LGPKAYSYLRMSTELQLKGDSRRRQLEASRAYVLANGLELAEDSELEDIGVSAFTGANRRVGALGRFLDAVRTGSVKPGSYLIVESLDRLSREEVLTAQSLFLSIIQAGINLVTLADGRVYQTGKTDLADLIMSLVIMSRAHEESRIKGLRVGAAWKNKRLKAATGQPMTKRCPAWLRLSSDRTRYEVMPERAEIVRDIFTDTVSGIGMYSVATRLNGRGIPAFVGSSGWHRSYIAKILNNRAVLGEFQPHFKVDGARVADGAPVSGYFPAIIDESLFYEAQHAKSQRRKDGAGRKGAGFTNLFSRLARCAYCRSPMAFENKGSGSKGGTYLICDSAQRRRGCESIRWRYHDFEASFLAFVQEVDIESIISEGTDTERRRKLEAELASIQGELSSVGDLMEKTYAVLSDGGAIEFVSRKLNELTQRQAELAARLKSRTKEHEDLLMRKTRLHRSREEIRQLVARLQSPADEELFKLRAQIASQLKVLVQTLSIAPLGTKPRLEASIDRLRGSTDRRAEGAIAHMDRAASHPDNSRRYFSVGFRDGNVRTVFPDDDDPLRYQQQIVANGPSGFEILRPENEDQPIA
jgi:DNA invertase Pin-like site-specific DNA recombinase